MCLWCALQTEYNHLFDHPVHSGTISFVIKSEIQLFSAMFAQSELQRLTSPVWLLITQAFPLSPEIENFGVICEKLALLMPCSRHSSETATPPSACLRIPIICASLNRPFFIAKSPQIPAKQILLLTVLSQDNGREVHCPLLSYRWHLLIKSRPSTRPT